MILVPYTDTVPSLYSRNRFRQVWQHYTPSTTALQCTVQCDFHYKAYGRHKQPWSFLLGRQGLWWHYNTQHAAVPDQNAVWSAVARTFVQYVLCSQRTFMSVSFITVGWVICHPTVAKPPLHTTSWTSRACLWPLQGHTQLYTLI